MSDATKSDISLDRKRLCNPWAHLDENGGFSAFTPIASQLSNRPTERFAAECSRFLQRTRSVKDPSDTQIMEFAVELQRMLWREHVRQNGGMSPSDPIQVLDPAFAIKRLGYGYHEEDTLGEMRNNGQTVEVAGVIDHESRHVKISKRHPPVTRLFSAAHELGHLLMHPQGGLHRDLPMDGARIARDKRERQADKFASYFLMPEKLLREEFKKRFLTEQFRISDETAFALANTTQSDLQRKASSLRALSRLLSEAQSYNRIRFISLAQQFGVSREAMAIRLEEIGAIS
ncbi:ImmA/IrrE family metallo-endopeptidase [Pseudazoarcus pumilus]|uniref:Peptidase n=1 Tax=Pseudazoarcus pumilus TaxID=2067960 RepID=A0A2I6S6S0_9RHOO|nr:ImmA/IrrE family metallo-endopeptidase [Pseudazoarcus pumilus]AUN94960.1 peptidase [Pseudazoarcus pumilus]